MFPGLVLLRLGLAMALAQKLHATEDYVQEDENVRKLVNIYSLEQHCVAQRCRGFDFPNRSEIAFFDLQTRVRIAPNGETYDIGDSTTNADTLIFENSIFANFPLHLFYTLDLSELDIRNCGVQHVSWEAFLLAKKLTVLLLSDNSIREIDEMTFNYASELQYLFMSANRLRRLHAKAFNGLRKLRHLDLSENRLKDLPAGVFDELSGLYELNLAGNRLRTIENELFVQNPLLMTLTLHTNRLSELGENVLRAQTKLLAIDLSHNHPLETIVLNVNARFLLANNCSLYRINVYGTVTNVDLRDNHVSELYFSEPEALETLILRNNALLQIASMSKATKLHYLDLADNPDLGDLPNPWHALALQRLDLSNTGLTALPIASLAELPQLRTLNISSNNISEINPSNFKYLDKLTNFYIHANIWNCFNLNMLMDLLIKPHGMSYTIDSFDRNFPGEYVNGIACMYRIDNEGSDENQLSPSNELGTLLTDKQKLSMDPAFGEIEELRKELKVIVSNFEEKIDRLNEMLNELTTKMAAIEAMNSTLWQQVTITV